MHARQAPTVRPASELPYLEVNPVNCIPIRAPPANASALAREQTGAGTVDSSATSDWERLTMTLFSVLVSGSLLAAYSPTTFYGTIVYVASTTLRPIFIYGTWRGWIYETTNPDPIIKLIECCYMRRHEEDLVGEEETYRML